MSFRITGLDPAPFRALFGRDPATLAAHAIDRVTADAPHAFPCRVTLRDAVPGETLLLLNYEHQPAETPYRSRHAIFVREGASERFAAQDTIPEQLRRRTLSLRAFDANHLMVDADLCEGAAAEDLIARLFEDPRAAYIHAHFARRGCYAALIERVDPDDPVPSPRS